MYGAILGDILGSIYERHNLKTNRPEEIELINSRCRFTDDTALTVAVAEALLKGDRDYKKYILKWARRHPNAGYGGMFRRWFRDDDPQPYNSFGNGSAMRVAPIGWVCKSLEETLYEAERSAAISHNHPEGIKGAQAVATAVFLAQINSKEDIKSYIVETFGYNLDRTLDDIRTDYHFDVTCQGSVPEAIIAFLESENFCHAIQLAISLGGDTDTIACMTGAIAEAFYRHDKDRRIPDEYIRFAHSKISEEMRPLVHEFCQKFTKADQSAFPETYIAAEEEKKRKREEIEQHRREKIKNREQYDDMRYGYADLEEPKTHRDSDYGGGIVARFDVNNFPKDDTLCPYEYCRNGDYFARYPEIAAAAASREPIVEPVPIENEIFFSLLFNWTPEEVYSQINPLSAGYVLGMFDGTTEQHCRILDSIYSDQSQLQYIYNVYKLQGIVYFSLIVASFEDTWIGDNRDPNRPKFIDFFRDSNHWKPLWDWPQRFQVKS